jgi:esterase/lipase
MNDSKSEMYFKMGYEKVALLIHGLNSGPHAVRQLALLLFNSGYNVYVPCLTGHCEDNVDGYLSVKYTDWIKDADISFSYLLNKFPNDPKDILICGISMGAILASYLAGKYRSNRLILLAPAFKNRNNISKVCFILKYIIEKIPKKVDISSIENMAQSEEYLKYIDIYSKYDYPVVINEFIKLQNYSDYILDKIVDTDIFIAWSRNDLRVGYNVNKYLVDKLEYKDNNIKISIYRDGDHKLTSYCRRFELFEDIFNFLSGYK